MTKTPRISVIMSVYNGEKYLKKAIESVLNQTYKDFEFVIINDGSKDDSKKILEEYKDPRIVLVSRGNKGLTKSLNEGIKKSKGEYIARMDADDISEPIRLEEQVKFMEEHKNVYLCGTWARVIDADENIVGTYRTPTKNHDIKGTMLWHNPFIHPSVMFRKEIVDKVGAYDENFRYAQDYEYWSRVVPHFRTANLPKYLIRYRILPHGITKSKNFKVRLLGIKIRFLILKRLCFSRTVLKR